MNQNLKVSILYDFRPGPWGGGNQFLKALRRQLAARGLDEPDPERADVILVNSHHGLAEAARLKRRHPEKSVVHRVAGPLALTRPRERELDSVIQRFNRVVASGTVFQSEWARRAWFEAGLTPRGHNAVIFNAPDPELFHSEGKIRFDRSRKTRLVANSWSPNPRKGFDVFADLDRSLDFDRFEMTFVGNSPVHFDNIRMLEPLPSAELAAELRRHDIYVTASRNEACSNSLLEAMHCGLPALALDDGSQSELIGDGGETFRDLPEALAKLDAIVARYDEYRRGIRLPSIAEVADRYVSFMTAIHAAGDGLPAGNRLGLIGATVAAKSLDHWLSRRALRASLALSGRRFR